MKKKETKALKPSEMGLHSKARFVFATHGQNRAEQKLCVIEHATNLFICLNPCDRMYRLTSRS